MRFVFFLVFTTVKHVLSKVLKKNSLLTLIRKTCSRMDLHRLLQCRALAVKLFSTHISSEKTAIFCVATHHSDQSALNSTGPAQSPHHPRARPCSSLLCWLDPVLQLNNHSATHLPSTTLPPIQQDWGKNLNSKNKRNM